MTQQNQDQHSTGEYDIIEHMIFYPRLEELFRDIKQCQLLSKQLREPQCMSLDGPTGAGKTTLVQDYASLFPRFDEDDRTIVPVFYLEMPSPATIKAVASKMLEALGDPAAYRGTGPQLDSRLIHLIRACRVQLVILDDFHHLIDTESDRVLERVSEWLKVLIKETHVPFLVVGATGRVERILRANDQLSRLFAVRETLEPFAWNWFDAEVIKKFHLFVQFAETSIGRPLAAIEDAKREELLWRLHYATNGIVANLMNLLRGANLFAEEHKDSKISLIALEHAFDRRVAKHLVGKQNPFLAVHGAGFVPPSEIPRTNS